MRKKIKICHVIGNFVNGGVESVIYNYFSNMDLENFEVHIIGHGIRVQECADRFANLEFRIHNITPKSVSVIKNIKEMETIIKQNKFDIVHSHLTEWACIPMFLSWKCGVKVRINHSHMAETPKGLKNILYYGIRLYLGKLFATDYFACGRDAGIYLFGKKSVAQGKVKIIPNAIDVKKFQYDVEIRQKFREELKIKKEDVILGNVGRFFQQKNHSFLIDIFAEYKKLDSNAKLMLFGDGKLIECIKNKVSELGLKEDVYFMGVKNDIYNWYSVMDVFILPSLYEGLPVVGVEAQISDLLCFFSTGITSEIAINKNAHFLDLNCGAEKWAKVINEKVKSTKIKLRKKHVEGENQYNICVAAKELEKYYKNAVFER